MQFVRRCIESWKVYRYRFVPWMKLNVSPQKMMACVKNKVVTDQEAILQLIEVLTKLNGVVQSDPSKVLKSISGFQLIRKRSQIKDAGVGVFIAEGKALKGQIVAVYPGTVYFPSDFIFFQSLSNKFIFRCVDNLHIDAKNSGISKFIYKSCSHRDRVGPHPASDMSWLNSSDKELTCPLNIGQFVNNKPKDHVANVQYQELNIMHDFPLELRKFIPNVNVNGLHSASFVRTVVLVALTDIYAGEELFSDYFTFTQT